MLQFNVVWCIHSRREIVLTIQSDNGKQGYKVGGKKYRCPKVVLSQRPLRTVLQRLHSETRGILSSQRDGDVRKNKTAQSWRVTRFAAQRQTMEPLEFSKTGKKRRLKRQIFCFCGVTVVSSTVFEREMSCQHVNVKMRMLRFSSVEKPGIIPRWGQSVSDRDFHTCLFFMYDTLLLHCGV